MKYQDKQHLQLIGSRILSELNDLKRTIDSVSKELGISTDTMKKLSEGILSFPEVIEILFQLEKFYPIDASEILMPKSDCPNGIKFMKFEKIRIL